VKFSVANWVYPHKIKYYYYYYHSYLSENDFERSHSVTSYADDFVDR
jgi:hypothetical protein